MKRAKELWQKLEQEVESVPKKWFWLFFLVFLLRLPSLFEPYWYGDEGIYLTIGQGLRQGLVLYRDIYDNKPPLIYLLAALGGSLFWLKFILLVWNLITIVLFNKLAKFFFPKKENFSFLLTTIFAALVSLPALEGNIANAENFFIGLIIAGVWFFWQKKYRGAGLFMGLAFLFKFPPLFDFAALLFFILFSIENRKDLQKKGKEFFSLVGWFLLPFLITIIYSILRGNFVQYIESAILANFSYTLSWGGGAFSPLGLTTRGIILFLLLGMFFKGRKKWQNEKILFLSLWLALALFGALLSSRPYPHYLLQIVAPFILLTAALFAQKNNWRERQNWFLGLPLFLSLAAFFLYGFQTYRTGSYYQNFLALVLGQKDKPAYFSWFDARVNQTYALASQVVEKVSQEERIFIWGDDPNIYALSRRLPATRFTVSYHVVEKKAYEETLRALKEEPPRLIIVLDNAPSFANLMAFLGENYLFLGKEEGGQIWYQRQ
jgi:hypothetical protein